VGPDFVGVFSTLFQGLITLLAGRSLTDAGQRSLERILSHININRKYAHIANTILALAVLLIVIGLRLSLPVFARYYNDHGVNLQRSGQITAALQDYQRAVSLTPNYAVAHYNLGTAYEDILAYDLAASSYQTAVRSDNNLYAAYSNLARVYMLHQNNFASALPLLDTALDLPLDLNEEDGRAVRYSMLKNRGWAFLGLTYYILAEADIRQALELFPNGAAAHCLMAQLLEAQNKTKEALPNWEACLRYEKEDVVPVEARWISQARQRLSEEAAP
jgi:tetratricopeptide (TPR) repeat protein